MPLEAGPPQQQVLPQGETRQQPYNFMTFRLSSGNRSENGLQKFLMRSTKHLFYVIWLIRFCKFLCAGCAVDQSREVERNFQTWSSKRGELNDLVRFLLLLDK